MSLRRAAAPSVGLALSVALFLQAGQLDEWSPPDRLGPSFWPRLVLVGLGLACLAGVIAAWRRPPTGSTRAAASEIVISTQPAATPALARLRLAVALALLVLYVAATPLVGFPLATAGFVVGFMWLGGGRRPLGTLATAAVGTTALLYLFVKLVYLPLPKGEGPFEALTLALYRALHIF